MHSFDFSRRLAEARSTARLRSYCAAVDTPGEGLALVVFNPLGSPRTDVVIATVGFATRRASWPSRSWTPTASPLPPRSCARSATRTARWWRRRSPSSPATCRRWATASSTWSRRDADDADAAVAGTPLASGVLENELYRVQVDPGTGAITRLDDKARARDVLAAPGNIVVRSRTTATCGSPTGRWTAAAASP